jgi:olefin beta-lactone synthetase
MLYIGNKYISYKDLFFKAINISQYFQNLGLKTNDKVILIFPISIEFYSILLALFRLGITVIFIEPRVINNLEDIINHTKPKAVIYNYKFQFFNIFSKKINDNLIPLRIVDSFLVFPKEIKFKIPKNTRQNNIEKEENEIENIKKQIFNKDFFENIAIISFTSGTTGTPKGIIRTYKNLFKQGEYLFNIMKINEKDIDFTNLPLFVLKNIYFNISSYLYYVSNWRFINIKEILNFLRKSTSITASVGLLKTIVKYCKEKKILISNIKVVYTGGAPCYLEFLKEVKGVFINADVNVLYGSTEAEPISHTNLIDLENIRDLEGVCVGKPIKEVDVKIVNKIKIYNLEDFEVGEVAVSGENVCQNYIFSKQNKIEIDNKLYHLTGDVGYFDNAKNLWILGRIEHKIFFNNFYLFPLQIEKEVNKIELIENSAFIMNTKNNKAIILIKPIKYTPAFTYLIKNKVKELILKKFGNLYLEFDIIFGDIPLDKRHNAKINYSKLKKILKIE